jgi:hypothetical protein
VTAAPGFADFGVEVPFAGIEAALREFEALDPAALAAGRPAVARTATATLIVIGGPQALRTAAPVVDEVSSQVALRILLVPDTKTSGELRARINIRCAPLQESGQIVCGELIALEGGASSPFAAHIVASLRLADLPAFIWWRSAEVNRLVELGGLVERIVLDVDDPVPGWQAASQLLAGPHPPGVTDLRWTILTRWRALVAQFFDVPSLAPLLGTIDEITIEAADRPSAALLAGWFVSSLGWTVESQPDGVIACRTGRRPVRPDGRGSDGTAPAGFGGGPEADPRRPVIRIQSASRGAVADHGPGSIERIQIRAGSGRGVLHLGAAQHRGCIDTTAAVDESVVVSRVVATGALDRAALIRQELQIRTRDIAFERALSVALPLMT